MVEDVAVENEAVSASVLVEDADDLHREPDVALDAALGPLTPEGDSELVLAERELGGVPDLADAGTSGDLDAIGLGRGGAVGGHQDHTPFGTYR